MDYTHVNNNLNTIITKFPFIWDSKKAKESKVDVSDSEKVAKFSNGGHSLKKWSDLNTIEKEKLIKQLKKYNRSYGETALAIDLIMHGMNFPGLDNAPTPAKLNLPKSGFYADSDRQAYDDALNNLYDQLYNENTKTPQTKAEVLVADLFKTLQEGKVDDAQELIKRLDAETLNKAKDKNGHSALRCAVNIGNIEIAKAILEKQGININIKDNGATPLQQAALIGNEEILNLLIEKGADINATNRLGATVLDCALGGKDSAKTDTEKAKFNPIIETLKNKGAKTGKQMEETKKQIEEKKKNEEQNNLAKELLSVIGQENGQERALEIIKKLDAKHLNETKDENGHSALHCAANIGNVEITKALLAKKGINLEVTDNGGNTALHQAAYNDKPEIIDLLVKAGANKEAVDTSGHTPLMDAVANDKLGATQKLIELKANVNAKPQLQTPLDLAKSDAIKDALINAGATKEIEVVRRLYNISEQDYEKMQKRIKTKGEKPKYDRATAHQTVIDWAADRNKNRPKNKLKPTAYAQGIKNIKRMEELGLLPKGINGISNAEVYLYRLHQSRLFYSPQELVKHTNGEFITIDKALGSESGKAFRTVFKDLTSKELTDDQLKDYARTVLVTEGCVNNFGQCRTTPKIPEKGKNASYNAGASHNIETASETLTKSGKDITQDTEYDIADDLKRKDNLLVLNASQKNR